MLNQRMLIPDCHNLFVLCMQSVRVIAGLGNPESRYDGTRHNIGFAAVDRLAEAHSASWKAEARFCAHTASVVIAGKPVLLLKPQTFMNASSKAIGNVCRYYKWSPKSVLVVVDEFQFPLGQTKLTLKGSAGGHNGVDDIVGQLGSEFPRLRIGIAPDQPTPMKMTDYVLGKFSPEEINTLATCWERILSEMKLIIQKGPDLAINTINQRILKNEPTKKSQISSDHYPGHPRV
jgi:PTH1 family peptidyl-tRNA hydrolase